MSPTNEFNPQEKELMGMAFGDFFKIPDFF